RRACTKALNVRRRSLSANSIATKAPTPDASVGVAKPEYILPMTTINKIRTGPIRLSDCSFSLKEYDCPLGAESGHKYTNAAMVKMMDKQTKTPGIIAPINNADIEISAITPYKIRAIEGGMIIARVPEIATTPPANFGS